MDAPRFRPSELTRYVEQILKALDVTEDDARTTADCLITANLRGVDTHGIRLLPIYARRLESGAMNPRPHCRVIASDQAWIRLDGDNGLGPVLGAHAMDEAVARARTTGIAAAVVCHSNHFGAAAWYALRAVSHGLIGVATSNGTPALAPWGGRMPFFGANPVAVAVPAKHEPPIVLDMATSVSSRARIRQRALHHEPIPFGWAIAPDGRPTTDATQAIAGALLPIGGAKGSGLALILEVLTGGLAGAGFSYENYDLYADLTMPQGLGHFFLALNPAAFLPGDTFGRRIDALIRTLRDVPPAAQVDRVQIPGERSMAQFQQRVEHGIEVPLDQVAELRALGAPYGLAFPAAIGELIAEEGEQS